MDLQPRLRYFQLQHERRPAGRFWIPVVDILLRTGRLEEARAFLDKGLETTPGSISGRWLLAVWHRQAGDPKAARRAAAEVLALDPEHRGVARLLEELDTARNAVREPEPTPAPDLSLVPDPEPDPEPDACEASPSLDASDTAPGAEEDHSAPAVEGVATSPTFVTRTLADIYLSQGHRDKALRILEQVLSANPERDDIAARIADLTGAENEEPLEEEPAAQEDHASLNRERFTTWIQREVGGAE